MSSNSKNLKLTDFKVLVFDVYGTLADAETGLYNALIPLVSRFTTSAGWTRSETLLAFSAIERELQEKYPSLLYRDLLAKAHEILEDRLEAESPVKTTEALNPERHILFGQSIKDWPIFPDSSEALHALSEHYKLVVLSNVDRASFAHTLAKLSEGDSDAVASSVYTCPDPNPAQYWFPQKIPGTKSPFTLIITAQDVESYKPALKGFYAALACIQEDPALLGEPGGDSTKESVLSVAQSLSHDIEPASQIGLKGVWINRKKAATGLKDDGTPKWTWKFDTLGEMAAAVKEELEVAKKS